MCRTESNFSINKARFGYYIEDDNCVGLDCGYEIPGLTPTMT